MTTKIYTSKNKQKVLNQAKKKKQNKISLWKDEKEIWHAACGPQHVPDWATEIEHIQ